MAGIIRQRRVAGLDCPTELATSSLHPIDHGCGRCIEEFSNHMLGLDWQRGFHKSITHQLHPAVTRGLIDRKRNMPRTEAGMASLFCVARRPSEPVDQEISKARCPAPSRSCGGYMGFQEVVLQFSSPERRHQTREAFRANHRVNLTFVHVFGSV